MSRSRTSFMRGVRDLVPLAPAGVSFGLVVGAAVTQAGLGLAESVGMSTLVYGASAQLAATTLWSKAAPLVVVVITALVINSRFFIYSASLAPVLRPKSWYAALGLAYFVRDGAYAATVTKAVPDPEVDEVAYYLGASTFDWAVWLAATTAGALGAALIPTSWSLDFVVPLVFVALLAGALDSRLAVESALVSALAAFLLIPALPVQSGLLAAIVLGMGWGTGREAARGRGAGS